MRVLSSLIIVVSIALSVDASSLLRREEAVYENDDYDFEICSNVVTDGYASKLYDFEQAIEAYQGNVDSVLTDKYNVATAALEKSLGFCCSNFRNPIIGSSPEKSPSQVLYEFAGKTFYFFLVLTEKEPKFKDSPADYDFAKKVLTSMEGPAKKLLGCLSANVDDLYFQEFNVKLLKSIADAQAAYKLNSTAATPAA